jgi:hypothetical protein
MHGTQKLMRHVLKGEQAQNPVSQPSPSNWFTIMPVVDVTGCVAGLVALDDFEAGWKAA